MVLLPVSRKKIHPAGQKQIKHFCPRAKALGQKCFICFRPLGWIFFLLTGGKTISTRLNYIEITQCYLLAFLDYKMEFFRDFHLGWKKMQTRKRKLPLSKQQLSLGNYEIVWTHWGGWWHSFKLRQKEGWISRKFIFSEGKRYLSLTDVVRNWLLLPILPTYTNI